MEITIHSSRRRFTARLNLGVRPNDTMGLLAKIFGAVPRDEMRGIRLDMGRPFWEVSGKTDFPSLLMALPELLPGVRSLFRGRIAER